MKNNPLNELETLGQSIWLDYIRRDLIVGGELQRLIKDDSVRGMTSNPSIFEKAIAESHLYDQDIRDMAREKKMLPQSMKRSASATYRTLPTSSGWCMKQLTAKTGMSALRSIPIWRMTHKPR